MGEHQFRGKNGQCIVFPREKLGGHSFIQNQYPATAAHLLFYS